MYAVSVPISFRVTPEEHQQLKALANVYGKPYNRVIVDLVTKALEAVELLQEQPTAKALRAMPAKERDDLLRSQSYRAAQMYAQHPELIADGSDDVVEYVSTHHTAQNQVKARQAQSKARKQR